LFALAIEQQVPRLSIAEVKIVGLLGFEKSIPALSPKHQILLLNCENEFVMAKRKKKNVKQLFIGCKKCKKPELAI